MLPKIIQLQIHQGGVWSQILLNATVNHYLQKYHIEDPQFVKTLPPIINLCGRHQLWSPG